MILKLFTLNLLLVMLTSSCNGVEHDALDTTGSDSVVYSFAVLGCNRIDKADTAGYRVNNPSTANLAQLDRTLADVALLQPKPDFVFFTGDMVIGYANDSTFLRDELQAWKNHVEHSPVRLAGIPIIAIPGNHESQNEVKKATTSAERTWLQIMAPYIYGSNGPTPETDGVDGLQSDQSRLTYSFNFKDAHFVVISSDPVGRDWRPPSHWIADDISEARSNPSVKHIFAFAHKPAYAWDYGKPAEENDGLGMDPANRDILWNALEANHAEAMIAAHNHVYRAFQPHNKTWMVVAGNGGSKLEPSVYGKDAFYGFTLIQVMSNGNVIEKSYGRNFGPTYHSPCPSDKFPTTVRDSNVLSW